MAHSLTILLLTVTLTTLSVPCTTIQNAPHTVRGTPDYVETIAEAQNVMATARHQFEHLFKLQQSHPELFSSVLFQHELIKGLEQFAMSDRFGSQLLGANISDDCVNNITELLNSFMARKSWAVTMIDAMGKPSPDLLGGSFIWPGAFEECLKPMEINITTMNVTTFTPFPFETQYCRASLTLLQGSGDNPFGLTITMGLCVPQSCSETDLEIYLVEVLQELNITKPLGIQCPDFYPQLDSLAIAAIVVTGIFIFLMVVGTLVDIVFYQIPKWRQEQLPDFSANGTVDHMAYHDDIILLGALADKGPEPKFWHKLLMAFSVYTNGAKLLSTDQSSGTLGCIHGIRFISMTWVVLGHSYLMPLGASGNMLRFALDAVNDWTFQAIGNGTVSVDTFFVLSGLLVSYLSMKELKRRGGKMNWFLFYFHRFWRLTPAYMMIIFLYLSLGPYLGSGPQWQPVLYDRENCRQTWWTNLLYINNFVQSDKMCLGQSWYLANDMQFYIISPLILLPLFWHPLLGLVVVLVFLLATTIVPAALTMRDHFAPGFLVQLDDADTNILNWQKEYYIRPYNRMGPYIIGMVTGYFLYKTDCKVRMNKAVNILGWAAATATALAILYGLYPYRIGQTPSHFISLSLSAFYNSVSRTAWGAAVAWVIFACCTGYGGVVNTLLSCKAFVPLSRLTYVIYLLHMWVLSAYILSRDTAFFLNHVNVVVLFLGGLIACYGISAVVSLAFEAPFLALEKVIFKRQG